MKPSDDLFLLIKSMSQSEKRSFRLDANRYKDDQKKYVALFEAMQCVQEYDEAEVKRILARDIDFENFTSLKNNLWQRIKQFLKGHNSERTLAGRGFAMVQVADILQKRGLVNAAKREVAVAAKVAEKLDLIDLKLQVNEVRRSLVARYERKRMREGIARLQAERRQLLAVKMEEEKQAAIYYRLSAFVREDFELHPEEVRHEADRLLRDELLSEGVVPGTFRARRLQMMSRSFCFHSLRRLEDEFRENEKILELWDRHPAHQEEFSVKYRVAICNYLHISAQLGRFDGFKLRLDQLEALPVHNEDEEVEAFSVLGHYRLLDLLNRKDIAAALTGIEVLEVRLNTLGPLINPSTRIGMLVNIALTHFIDENPIAALRWIDRVQNESSDHRIDLQGFSRVMEVMIRLDQHYYEMAEARARATQEWLRRKNRLRPFENSVLNALRTMAGKPSAEWRRHFRKLDEAIGKMKEEGGTLMGMDEVRLWCQARMARRGMREVFEAGEKD